MVDKGSGAKITTEIDLPDKIDAPVEKNRKIGTLTYLVNSKRRRALIFVQAILFKKQASVHCLNMCSLH